MHLSSRITLSILIVPAVLIGVIGTLSINEERIALQSILRKQGDTIAQSIAAYSVEALASEDYPALEHVLQTIGPKNNNIELIEVSQNNKVVARYGTLLPHDHDQMLVSRADITLNNHNGHENKFGTVKLSISERDNEAFIYARIKSLTIYMLISFVLFSLILRYVLNRIVVRRIGQLKQLTEQVISSELPEQFKHGKQEGDEIDVLKERFISMLDGLHSRDMTRTIMLDEIAAAHSLLEDVANAMHSALIVSTRDGSITFCNKTALAMSGKANRQLIGEPLHAALPYSKEDCEIIFDGVINNRTIKRLPLRKLVDEQMHFFEAAVYPLSSSVGSVIRIDDVTERVRIQEAMLQTEKMASVGGLAAGIAHEINNPLGVMVQAAQNIERRLSETLEANHRIAEECGTTLKTIRSYLEKRSILDFLGDIKLDGERASKIVRNLLEFSRRSKDTYEPVQMDTLFSQAIELAQKDYDLKKNIDFRKIEVVIDVNPALPPVPMLRSQLEQVLLNLLKNSAQALADKIATDPAHIPRITLIAKQEGDFARIEVQDNGPGFSTETRRRAFEPFFTTKPPGIGTGLGLWISYAIVVDKHRGELMLDSAPGDGCTFIIRLPLKVST